MPLLNKVKTSSITLLFVSVLLLALVGCTPSSNTSMKKITPNTVVYANYANGEYALSILKPDTFELIDKMALIRGWGDKIFRNAKGQLWFPINYQPDMTTAENKVVIVDPVSSTLKTVTVGNFPRYIFFINEDAYVVCEEDGENPSIYRIDPGLKATKWKTVEHGGLISGAQSDGQNIYWSSLRTHDNPNLDYPMLVKVSVNGSVESKNIAEKRIGFNNLLYLDNKLYLGLEDNRGTFAEFDAKTLEPVRYFPYHDMVGDIIPLGDHQIALTNYSKKMNTGSTISIVNLIDGKITKSFNAKYLAERLSFVNGFLYVVDNHNLKLQKFNVNGESLNISICPTQTTNILSMK